MSVVNLTPNSDSYINATGRSDTINGVAGDDTISGLDGNDRIDGGTGFDIANYANDFRFGGTTGVIVNFATGKATDGFGNADTLISIEAVMGTQFADKLTGGNAALDSTGEYFYGLSGKDVIDGGSGFDEARYDRDAGFGGTKGIIVNLTTGRAVDGFGTVDTLRNIESVRGTAYADKLSGGDTDPNGANNFFLGLGGNDVIDGGSGYDELRYDKDANFGGYSGVTVNLAAGTAIDGFGATDTVRNIEGVRGTQYGDRLHGNDTNDRSFDSLIGLGGDDTIDGGGGNDAVRYDRDASFGGATGVTVDLARGTATDGFGNHDTLISIEVVRGTQFTDTLTGGNATSAAYEGFYGLGGNDTIDGGKGFDEVRYDRDVDNGGGFGVTVNLAAGTATDGFGTTDRLTGIEAIVGTKFDDRLTGDAFANRFTGHAGNDFIDGGAGIDTLDFRNDDLFGAVNGATVDLGAGTATGTFGSTYALTSIEAMLGSVFADAITGSKVANTLVGNAGDDRLDGLLGKDVLTGGAGSDTFRFSTAFRAANIDHITDFETADTIEIAKAVASALPTGTLAAGAFKDLSTGTADAGDRILYDRSTGTLSYDKDGSGSAAAVTFAVLDHPIALTNLDFHIV
ncbi:Bifunctional hemolysin/adenylate cyclase [Methylobacterium bullatum]|uniref:Bifunctional hemolysin/adenylate cyclase n=1 Tax=Methylobacterium bullatum TaxID=570505 RepID=A0A679J9L6_9HYPH|nr:Bifunctional hemolysin/adenylate cyclase [Methylobacterium bullatum]